MTDKEGTEPEIDPDHALEDVVDEAIESAHGHDQIWVVDILDDFGTRSFGPILIIVSLIIISPIGSIPGLPIALGAVVVLLAVQIIFGREHPWMPRKMREIGFDRRKAEEARDRWHGWLERIDHYFKQRMEWAAGRWAEWLAAFCLIFLSATMIPLELVPMAVTIPGVAMLLFGVGLTARDGLMMLLGFVTTVPSIVFTILWWPFGGGG